MHLLMSLILGPHVNHHGVVVERSPHQKQVVDRQPHASTNIPIVIMIQMQSRVPVTTAIRACILPFKRQNYPQIAVLCNTSKQYKERGINFIDCSCRKDRSCRILIYSDLVPQLSEHKSFMTPSCMCYFLTYRCGI